MTVRTIDEIFRDFVTDGVPASGPFNPHKPDIRDTLKALTEGSENFPDNRVIRLNNADEGTANNIVVTASVAIPAAAYQVLYILNVTQENTGPVTVSGAINRTLVTSTSQPVPAGYLTPGMAVLCIDTGSELRMLSYGDVESVVEDFAARAEAAEEAAELARDQAQNAASDAVSQGNVPIYSTRNALEGLEIPAGISALRTNGFGTVGDGGAALYKRVATEPTHAGKVQSDDGAWWEIAESVITPEMFGVKGDGTDESSLLHPAMRAAEYLKRKLVFGKKRYGCTRISLNYADWEMEKGGELFSFDADVPGNKWDDYFVRIDGVSISNPTVSSYSARMQPIINISSGVSQDHIGYLLNCDTRNLIHNQASGAVWTYGEVTKIKRANAGQSNYELEDPLFFNYNSSSNGFTATITSVISSQEVVCSGLSLNSNQTNYPATINGQQTYITDFSSVTKRMTFKTPVTGLANGQVITASRAPTLALKKPGRCKMVNVKFSRPITYDASTGDDTFVGLRVRWCDAPYLYNCEAEGFSYAGIVVQACYEPVVLFCRGNYANYAETDGDGFGYGLQGVGNRRGLFGGCSAKFCRKGIDISGPNLSDINSRVVDFVHVGGGRTWKNERFFPAGTTETLPGKNGGVINHGFGSHEGTFGTVYDNCGAIETAIAASIRGSTEIITKSWFAGNCLIPIRVMFTDSFTVDGFYNTDETLAYDEPSYIVKTSFRPQYGVLIWNTSSPSNGQQQSGQYVIKNMLLRALEGHFVRVDRVGRVPKIIYGGNIVNYIGSATMNWISLAAGASETPIPVDAGGNVSY